MKNIYKKIVYKFKKTFCVVIYITITLNKLKSICFRIYDQK